MMNIGAESEYVEHKLSLDIARDIKPTCFYSVAERSTAEGRSFIEVAFHGNRPPYPSRGRYFIRFHDEDRQMDSDMLRRYYLDRRRDYSPLGEGQRRPRGRGRGRETAPFLPPAKRREGTHRAQVRHRTEGTRQARPPLRCGDAQQRWQRALHGRRHGADRAPAGEKPNRRGPGRTHASG